MTQFGRVSYGLVAQLVLDSGAATLTPGTSLRDRNAAGGGGKPWLHPETSPVRSEM